MGKTYEDDGRVKLAPYTHFSFCPICGEEYQTWDTVVEFRCFSCGSFIALKKIYPNEIKEIPSCRWFE